VPKQRYVSRIGAGAEAVTAVGQAEGGDVGGQERRSLAGLLAKVDIDGVRSLGVCKQALQRIANASRVADLGKSLDQHGVDLDSARAFMKKFELKQPLGFADGARVAKFILRRGGILGYVRSVR
jgi:hypothetical protein